MYLYSVSSFAYKLSSTFLWVFYKKLLVVQKKLCKILSVVVLTSLCPFLHVLTKSCHNKSFYIIAELRDCVPSDFYSGKETFGQVEDHLCPKDCTSTNYLESLAISEVVPDAIEKNQDQYENDRYKVVPRY